MMHIHVFPLMLVGSNFLAVLQLSFYTHALIHRHRHIHTHSKKGSVAERLICFRELVPETARTGKFEMYRSSRQIQVRVDVPALSQNSTVHQPRNSHSSILSVPLTGRIPASQKTSNFALKIFQWVSRQGQLTWWRGISFLEQFEYKQ